MFGVWYAIDGSNNVNFTSDEIQDGTCLDDIVDSDSFSSDDPIESESQLKTEVMEYELN